MPFCPKCRYEYKPEITRCPDCAVELVAELPEEKPDEPLVVVASYPFEAPAQTAKLALHAHGIESVIVNEKMAQTDIVLVFADGGVKLMVRKSDAQRARKVLADRG